VADVTQLEAMQQVQWNKPWLNLGRIDIVFANAGVAAFGPYRLH
jgi:NADP-dependent 3-hydroxy acid dehydrogenase YdfG